jgi:glycosyltransferase involved in cell wall biosynthesis
MQNQQVFVIVPSFNEATVLGPTLESLSHFGYSIVVVDDGSEDDTRVVAARFPIHFLRHPMNLGQGAALQTGMTYALQRGAQVIVHFDADGQHPATKIPALIAPVIAGECDVVLGSRFLDRNDSKLVPRSKRLVLRVGRLVNGLFSGMWLTDAHNGFRALSRHAANSIDLRENGFAHATELLDQIRRANLRYKEIPTPIQYSEYSRQKGEKFWNGFNIVVDTVLRKVLR